MRQYLSNGELILDARDDLHRATAVLAHGHVDEKNSFQSLRPRHGDMTRGGLNALLALPLLFLSAPCRGHDLRAQAMMGGENSKFAAETQAGRCPLCAGPLHVADYPLFRIDSGVIRLSGPVERGIQFRESAGVEDRRAGLLRGGAACIECSTGRNPPLPKRPISFRKIHHHGLSVSRELTSRMHDPREERHGWRMTIRGGFAGRMRLYKRVVSE